MIIKITCVILLSVNFPQYQKLSVDKAKQLCHAFVNSQFNYGSLPNFGSNITQITRILLIFEKHYFV